MTLNYKIVHCKCEYCNKEFDIKRYSNYNGKEYFQRFCNDKCRRKYLMNYPIFINSQDELEKIKKTHPTGFLYIEYKCGKCGKLHQKEIRDRSRDYKLLCKGCLTHEIQMSFDKHKKDAILERINETKIKKYGSLENFNKIRQEKMKETCLKKYGVVNPFQISESKEKMKETCLKKYGVESYSKTSEFREKFEKTMLDRYGVNYTLQSNDLRNKGIETRVKNEGFDFKKKDVLKCKKTKLKRYNNENYNNNKKHKETCLQKYGVVSYSQTLEFFSKIRKKYMYDNVLFDSSWELAVWIYYHDKNISIKRSNDKFEYFCNGKTHYYFPDFKIDGKLVEIKGDHFIKDGKLINPFDSTLNELYECKYNCMLKHNVEIWTSKQLEPILTYIDETYGKKYLEQFRMEENDERRIFK